MLPLQPTIILQKSSTFAQQHSICRVSVELNHHHLLNIAILTTGGLTAKPDDITILTVVIFCSEPILSILFQFFRH